jgi:hypothetical protein
MSENTSYEFKLKILNIELFSLNVSSTAGNSKVIAAGTVFVVGVILLLGAYADKLIAITEYFTK